MKRVLVIRETIVFEHEVTVEAESEESLAELRQEVAGCYCLEEAVEKIEAVAEILRSDSETDSFTESVEVDHIGVVLA